MVFSSGWDGYEVVYEKGARFPFIACLTRSLVSWLVRWRWGWLRCWLWGYWFQVDAAATTTSSTRKERRWEGCSCHRWVRTFFFSLAIWMSEGSTHCCVAVHSAASTTRRQNSACRLHLKVGDMQCYRIVWNVGWNIILPVIVKILSLTMKLLFYLILSVVAGKFTWNA